ncbi:MAG: hypothetical protein MJE68_06945, partial [Proteobacteria bacterium]|nr:hypothetical protein [Pseudomonadota bacterium]
MLVQIGLIKSNSHTPLPDETEFLKKTEKILTKDIDNMEPYDKSSPLLQGQYPYPVIFEPIRHIKLSRSTYKVTSFLDFTPHIKAFENFEKYLDDLSRDMNDTDRVQALQHIQRVVRQELNKDSEYKEIDLVRDIVNFDKPCVLDIGEACKRIGNYVNTCYTEVKTICNVKRRYKKLLSIVAYIREDFSRTKKHFMEAIDHVQEKTKVSNSTSREKRSLEKEALIGKAYDTIDDSDYELINEILEKFSKVDLETGVKQTRQKRFGIMNWIMGWGIISNARNIKQLKKNVQQLYVQNVLQEQQIQD